MANLTEKQKSEIMASTEKIERRKFNDSDRAFIEHMNKLYGNAMTAKGINLLDPIEANMLHYNKTQMKGLMDYPRVTRSYVFFTRPEMNFSFENINQIPFFKWLYSKRIGKMIMSMLTDPDYFINAPAALNSTAIDIDSYEEIYTKMAEALADTEAKLAQNDKAYAAARNRNGPIDGNSVDFNTATEEELSGLSAEEIEQAMEDSLSDSINLDDITDASAMETLTDAGLMSSINSAYNEYFKNVDKIKARYATKFITMDSKEEAEYNRMLSQLGVIKASSWMNTDKNRPQKYNFTTPFIPLLSNCCTSLEGAKDISLTEHEYEEDKMSSNLKVAKGFDELWGTGSLTTSFEDTAYSPCGLLFMVWLFYIHYVSRGYIATTREHDTERVLDYTCSIYNFVLGSDGRHIERWAKYTGCYPTNFPFSSQIMHNIVLDPEILQKFSITWTFNRYEPMDPQVFRDFNFLSESEWLVKLKPCFWENLYNRKENIQEEVFDGYQVDKRKSGFENSVVLSLNRNMSLWRGIKPEDRGMSGKPPASLIECDYDGKITDYWGGYPYIINGDEFIWAMPEMTVQDGEITRDTYDMDNAGNMTKLSKPEIYGEDKYATGIKDSQTAYKNINNLREKKARERGI